MSKEAPSTQPEEHLEAKVQKEVIISESPPSSVFDYHQLLVSIGAIVAILMLFLSFTLVISNMNKSTALTGVALSADSSKSCCQTECAPFYTCQNGDPIFGASCTDSKVASCSGRLGICSTNHPPVAGCTFTGNVCRLVPTPCLSDFT